MNENILELHELDELKAAYNQMDERLEGQEIVSDENLREAMYNKFADMRRNVKESLVWLNLVLVPLFLWKDWYDNTLTLFGIIVMAVYWVASLLFRFFILRKTKKEDYGSYDLKTLTEKEARYQKNKGKHYEDKALCCIYPNPLQEIDYPEQYKDDGGPIDILLISGFLLSKCLEVVRAVILFLRLSQDKEPEQQRSHPIHCHHDDTEQCQAVFVPVFP